MTIAALISNKLSAFLQILFKFADNITHAYRDIYSYMHMNTYSYTYKCIYYLPVRSDRKLDYLEKDGLDSKNHKLNIKRKKYNNCAKMWK